METQNQSLLQFTLKAQRILQQDKTSDPGYAMLVVSIVTLLLFSLMVAFLTVTNISKASTNAYVDSTSTFYAAEAGLNQRVASLRQKFTNYEQPEGTSPGVAGEAVTAENVSNCYSIAVGVQTSNEFECRNYLFNSTENSALVTGSASNTTTIDSSKINKYTAYTFVADKTTYTNTNPPIASASVIPPGEDFAGLNAQNYQYTVYATATKQDMAVGGDKGDAVTILQADTTLRRIPIFQFAYFSDIDMEFAVLGNLIVNGSVHTNGNLYAEHRWHASDYLEFQGTVTAAGDIYNRQYSVPDWFRSSSFPPQTTRFLIGNSPSTYEPLPPIDDTATHVSPLTQSQLIPFNNKLKSSVPILKVPSAGFLRKRNYYDNKVSEYFGKADLRIEMVPDRAIPFDVTAITTLLGADNGSCISTYTPGSDPAKNYIDPTRQKLTGKTFNCTQLNKGQLMSLSQPVLVLTQNAEEETRFCKMTSGIIERTRDTIDYDGVVTADATMNALTATQRDKVIRALQTAIVSATTPIDYANVTKGGTLDSATRSVFEELLKDTTLNIGLSAAQIDSLTAAPPANIAKSRNSCFLPAPIAMVQKQDGTPGFFDRRERKLRRVLQTNIESLTIWNRDGRYVSMDSDLTAEPTIAPTDRASSLNYDNLYSTKQLLFLTATANPTSPVGSFEHLGLALADRTEGGLVLHETVNDNLSGDGTTDAANNVVADSTKPIYKLNHDTTPELDASGNKIILDYYRTGKGESKGANSAQRLVSVSSAYGFAISGGRNLPGPLTIATDRPMYLQGDYNTYPDRRQPAAILADTITALSANCVSPGTTQDLLNVKTGQLNCGVPFGVGLHDAATAHYNAAFVSNADSSIGNDGRPSSLPKYMGGGGSQYLSTLEDWGGKTLNALGSFVWIGSTLESDGAFIVNDVYSIYGNANYVYDSNFNSFNLLPPLTPMAVYLKQDVFKRKY